MANNQFGNNGPETANFSSETKENQSNLPEKVSFVYEATKIISKILGKTLIDGRPAIGFINEIFRTKPAPESPQIQSTTLQLKEVQQACRTVLITEFPNLTNGHPTFQKIVRDTIATLRAADSTKNEADLQKAAYDQVLTNFLNVNSNYFSKLIQSITKFPQPTALQT